MTLVDSNVLVDVLRGDPQWLTWSIEQLNSRASLGPVYFNEIVYSEGKMPELAESAVPHWDLAARYNLIDFELGNKITGAGFPVYKGKGARTECFNQTMSIITHFSKH